MSFYWVKKFLDLFTTKKHIFVVKTSDRDNTRDIIQTVSSSGNNFKVDVYTNCEDLFFNLNINKNYYDVGVVSKNDKKNTANILSNIVNVINPQIKIVTYSDKKTFKKQLSYIR